MCHTHTETVEMLLFFSLKPGLKRLPFTPSRAFSNWHICGISLSLGQMPFICILFLHIILSRHKFAEVVLPVLRQISVCLWSARGSCYTEIWAIPSSGRPGSAGRWFSPLNECEGNIMMNIGSEGFAEKMLMWMIFITLEWLLPRFLITLDTIILQALQKPGKASSRNTCRQSPHAVKISPKGRREDSPPRSKILAPDFSRNLSGSFSPPLSGGPSPPSQHLATSSEKLQYGEQVQGWREQTLKAKHSTPQKKVRATGVRKDYFLTGGDEKKSRDNGENHGWASSVTFFFSSSSVALYISGDLLLFLVCRLCNLS